MKTSPRHGTGQLETYLPLIRYTINERCRRPGSWESGRGRREAAGSEGRRAQGRGGRPAGTRRRGCGGSPAVPSTAT